MLKAGNINLLTTVYKDTLPDAQPIDTISQSLEKKPLKQAT